jgi:hypothetical protein
MSVKKVLELVASLEESTSTAVVDEAFQESIYKVIGEAITSVANRLSSEDIVDFDSAGFELNYSNQVTLESIDVNAFEIEERMNNGITNALEELFHPAEAEA